MPYELYVFGSNGEGQLGISAAEIVAIPTLAPSWPSAEDIKTVCGGDNHTLFLTSTGRVYGAGDNRKGQLGAGENIMRLETVKELGMFHTDAAFCAATCESSASVVNDTLTDAKSRVRTVGTGHWGEASPTNTAEFANHKTMRSLPSSVVDFAAGGWHYVTVLSTGEVWAWGKSRLDQLGPRLSAQQRIIEPTLIDEDIPFRPVKAVCGKEFTYLASHPTTGEHCLLGRDRFSLRSSMPPVIQGWKQVGATWNAIFVLFEDGSLTAWGKNNMWQLLPDDLPLIAQIAVGSEHVLALTIDGKLLSWGWGKHGNCGDLTQLKDKAKHDMVSGFWNEISIPGKIEFVGAGFCTSFVLTKVAEEGCNTPSKDISA